MSTPADARFTRCFAALQPFVERYGLPLNPEDVELMVTAVLQHIDSPAETADIAKAVHSLIDRGA
jgi:hypothetical protein